MEKSQSPELETDPRFPSGPWTGFFLQPIVPGRHLMDLRMTFRNGAISGEGRDWVGKFSLRGQYSIADGKCYWSKCYVGKHDVFYQGFNEGKGIWGVWEIPSTEGQIGQRGGFHIWPEGMPDPTKQQLTEQADLPVTVSDELELSQPLLVPAKN